VITSAMVCSSLVMGNASCQYESVAAAYAGWYVGCGISYQYTKGDIVLDDNASELGFGLPDVHGISLLKANVGRVGAALSVGYGDFITGNCYLGGEINLDIAGSKSNEHKDNDLGITKLKTRGFVPTVALRLGGYVPSLDCIFYARFGFTFLNNKFESQCVQGQGFGSQKITPIVGLGIEKTIFDGCSMRIEGDYRFSADRKKNDLVGYDPATGDRMNDPYRAAVKNRVRGYVVRVVCVYHF
ncbi:MAG: hypothetical protein IJT36_00315, partial [Alphaproteobacteria bacterium]|nr:hypothetical protein [Alphaproteobacteria bacterium]